MNLTDLDINVIMFSLIAFNLLLNIKSLRRKN